ncbi:zinc ribbon domain-containing protein [Candidatus Pacearchaeota archaeon]|nr:zinc ribbon domain-containing protein [Candidatus Pacearchaeota archaeon]
MFKQKCLKCNSKVSKNYDFCPHCGNSFRSENYQRDYGFLGKKDIIEDNPFEMFENSFTDKLFENAMKIAEKMIEKQIKSSQEFERIQPPQPPKQNPNTLRQNNLEIQFFVNGKRVLPQEETKEVEEIIPIINKLSREKTERFSKSPKTEPKSKVRRFSGKIIYELEMPGVKKIEDVFVNRFEDSIEIKAIGKDKVYSKTLNISLPILGYKLEQENLILELKA